MNKETFGALERIIEEVEQKRKSECLMKNCIVNDIIGGNDIDLVKKWMSEIEDFNKSIIATISDLILWKKKL